MLSFRWYRDESSSAGIEMSLVSAGASSTDAKRLPVARKLIKRNTYNVERVTSSYGAGSAKL